MPALLEATPALLKSNVRILHGVEEGSVETSRATAEGPGPKILKSGKIGQQCLVLCKKNEDPLRQSLIGEKR